MSWEKTLNITGEIDTIGQFTTDFKSLMKQVINDDAVFRLNVYGKNIMLMPARYAHGLNKKHDITIQHTSIREIKSHQAISLGALKDDSTNTAIYLQRAQNKEAALLIHEDLAKKKLNLNFAKQASPYAEKIIQINVERPSKVIIKTGLSGEITEIEINGQTISPS